MSLMTCFLDLSLLTCHSCIAILDLSLFTCHSWPVTFNLSPSRCYSQDVRLDMLLSRGHAQHVILNMSPTKCHPWYVIFDMLLSTLYSWHSTLNMPLSSCHSQLQICLSIHVPLIIQSWRFTLDMSMTCHSRNVTLKMLLSGHVTLDMPLPTCHSGHVYIIYVTILRDFGVSNFFVSDSVTLARPRGAFAPKKYAYRKNGMLS